MHSRIKGKKNQIKNETIPIIKTANQLTIPARITIDRKKNIENIPATTDTFDSFSGKSVVSFSLNFFLGEKRFTNKALMEKKLQMKESMSDSKKTKATSDLL